jgi:hypothetical protein
LVVYLNLAELQQEYSALGKDGIGQALACAAASLEDRIVKVPYEATT